MSPLCQESAGAHHDGARRSDAPVDAVVAITRVPATTPRSGVRMTFNGAGVPSGPGFVGVVRFASYFGNATATRFPLNIVTDRASSSPPVAAPVA